MHVNRSAMPIVSSMLFIHSAGAAPQVPLCPGLTIVTAVNQTMGDYESIKTLESVGPKEMRIRYSSEAMDSDGLSPTAGQVVTTTVYRKVLMEDQRSASLYQQIFQKDSDELIPGTTSLGTSAHVLRALKANGEGPLSISLVPPGQPLKADRQIRPHAYDYFMAGKLQRVGIVKVPVLVNERPMQLTAVQARGEFAGEQSEFLFLDDEANPLTLRFRLGIDTLKPMVPELKETCASMRKVACEQSHGLGDICARTVGRNPAIGMYCK